MFYSHISGRRAYDNFLVAEALLHGFYVVDASKTLTALHQSINHKENRSDAHYNVRQIGKYDFSLG